MRLLVDVSAEVVVFELDSGKKFDFYGQWVEFYSLLALLEFDALPTQDFLTAEDLFRVGRWAKPSFSSVGGEVARHLQELQEDGLNSAFRPSRKTKKWRLALARDQITLTPDMEAVKKWLYLKGWQATQNGPAAIDQATVNWITSITLALFALQKGDIDDALDLATAASNASDNPVLHYISNLALLRCLQRRGASESEVEEIEHVYAKISSWNEGFLSNSVRARAEAVRALSTRFDDADAELKKLVKLATQLHNTGDVGALGVIYNVMGILAKRKEDLRLAERYFRMAIPLLALSNDLPGLQAANVNLAQTLYLEYKLSKSVETASSIDALYESEYRIATEYGFGRDSGQAEITAARFALQQLDLEKAKRFLDLAEKICSASERDQGPLAWTKARYLLAVAASRGKNWLDSTHEALKFLNVARRIYAEAGECPIKLEEELAAVKMTLQAQGEKVD
jgi:tetratricopeptide (TPR) repeat protein